MDGSYSLIVLLLASRQKNCELMAFIHSRYAWRYARFI